MLPYLDVRRVYNMVSHRSALLVLEDLSVANWSIGRQTVRVGPVVTVVCHSRKSMPTNWNASQV
jgi:hypothetical protein